MSKKIQIDVDINTKNASNSVGELNNYLNNSLSTIDELREVSAALNEELAKTEIGSEAFNNLSNQLKVVNSELMATEDNIKVLSNDEINSNLKGMATGLTDFAGGLALIGVSGGGLEKIAQTFAKVQGASKVATGAFEAYTMGMKVVQGITQAATIAQTKLAASTATATTATAAQGNVSTIAAVKMRVLNLVMSANPVFLLIGGITALVGALYLFSDSAETAEEKQTKLNDAQEAHLEIVNKEIDSYQKLRDLKKGGEVDQVNEIKLLKARGASVKEIYDAESELIRTQLDDLSYNSGYRGYLTTEELKQKKTLKNDLEVLELTYNKTINDELDRNAQIRRDNNNKILDQQRSFLEKLKMIAQKLAEDEEIALAIDEEAKLQIIYERQKKEIELLNKSAGDTKASRIIMNAALVDLEEAHLNKINDLRVDAENKRIETKKRIENELKVLDNQTLVNDIKANEQIELATAETEEEKYDIRVKYVNILKDLEKERLRIQMEIDLQSIEGTENTEAKKAAIRAKYDLDIATLDNTKVEEKEIKDEEEKQAFTDKQQFMMDTAIQFAQAATDAIQTILDNRAIAEQAKIDERYNYENESLKASLANREISQAEYDTKVELLNKRKEQQDLMARKKAFNSAKKMQLIQANISGAQAVLAAVSSGMAVPIIGPATAAVYAAIAGALAAVQIGAIASQKFQAARGGVVPGQASMTDSVDAFLAPGEMVINSNSAKMFAPILSDINMAGGGIPLAPQQPKNYSGSNTNDNQTVTAVVIESDITDSQRRINRYERRKEF